MGVDGSVTFSSMPATGWRSYVSHHAALISEVQSAATGSASNNVFSSTADCGRAAASFSRQRKMIRSIPSLTGFVVRWPGGTGAAASCFSWISEPFPRQKYTELSP